MTAPAPPADATIPLRWTAADSHGDALRYIVRWSPDGGYSLVPGGRGLTRSELDPSAARLPGSSHGLLRVDATDGIHVATATAGPIAVGGKPPEVSILRSADGAALYPGLPVHLEAVADDLENGLLSGGHQTQSRRTLMLYLFTKSWYNTHYNPVRRGLDPEGVDRDPWPVQGSKGGEPVRKTAVSVIAPLLIAASLVPLVPPVAHGGAAKPPAAQREWPRQPGGPKARADGTGGSGMLATTTFEGTPSPALVVADMTNQTPEDLVRRLVGDSGVVSNVRFSGSKKSAGTFTGGAGVLGFGTGVALSTGLVANIPGPNEYAGVSWNNGYPGDPDLDALVAGYRTYDATVLEFDVVPTAEILAFQFVFGSEEYSEFVGSEFNDVFGFSVNGHNIALVPGDGGPISINTINGKANFQYFRDNTAATINTEMDGLTAVMTVQAHVKKNEANQVKLAIADTSDRAYDSNVLIRSVKAVDPPRVEITRLNNTGDSWYDNTFIPGELNWLDIYVYLPGGALPATADIYIDGELIGTSPADYHFTVPWQAPATVTGHTIRADVRDQAGNVYTGYAALYALVTTTGSVLSYLPTGSVRDPDLDMDISPFHEDDLPPEAPLTFLSQHLEADLYRQIITLTVEGKSNGWVFTEKPRVSSDFQGQQSWYCDDPDPKINRAARSHVFPIPPYTEEYDGTHMAVEQFAKSMVNAYAPDVWNPVFVDSLEEIFAKVGLPSPMPPRNAFTGGHSNVPRIFSAVRAEIWADGRTAVNWIGARSSWFPYHYAYKDGILVGGPNHHPPADLARWTATVPYMQALQLGQASLPKFRWPLSYLNELNIDEFSLYLAITWFRGLRAECARARLQEINPEDYDTLHENFPKAIPRHFQTAWLPYRPELWPHLFPIELAAGEPWPKTRSPTCNVPGCPGTEKRWYFISYYSPVHAHVYDSTEKHTGRRADGSVEMALPGVYYGEVGHLTFLMVPDNPGYRVEFEGYDTGTVTINMTLYDGPGKIQYLQYLNLPVNPISRGVIQLGGTVRSIRYDEQGTGTMIEVNPTVISTNPASDDTDAAPPTTSAAVAYMADERKASGPVVTLTLTALDDLSGVERTEYSMDGGQTWVRYGLPVTLKAEDAPQVRYRSMDYNGNIEEARSLDSVLDTFAPTVRASVFPPPNMAGWNNTDVTITFACQDEGSGIAYCSDTITLTAEGSDLSATGTATDQAGNGASITVAGIRIDKTVPTITISGAGTHDVDQVVTVTCTARDNLSGLLSDPCIAALAVTPAYALGPGERTFQATATDLAGNSATASATVSVVLTHDGLCRLTQQFVTRAEIARSLCHRLELAKRAAERGDHSAGDGQIRGYFSEVAALNPKLIAADQRAILTSLAEALLQRQ